MVFMTSFTEDYWSALLTHIMKAWGSILCLRDKDLAIWSAKLCKKGCYHTLYNIFRETVFCGDSYKRGTLPECILLLSSLRAGELSGMVPGKLPNRACFSRPSGPLTVSLGNAASFWGLRSSPEWVPPTSACEKGRAPCESQDFLEDGFLEDGNNITRLLCEYSANEDLSWRLNSPSCLEMLPCMEMWFI